MPLRFTLFSIAMSFIVFASCAQAADNVFLPPGGGDLLDPANWSNGVLPLHPDENSFGYINQKGPQTFTISSNGTEMFLFLTASDPDITFDLQGRSIRADMFQSIPESNNQRWIFNNGQFLPTSLLRSFFPNGSSKSADFELHQFNWQGGVDKIVADNGKILIDDRSSINHVWFSGKTQNMEIKGHSSVTASTNNYEVVRLDGTDSVSLIVDENSSLGPGLYRLNTRFTENDPQYAAELVVRGGSTTSNIELRISPISTILIEGEGTHADFRNLNLAAGFLGTPYDLLSTTTVKDKATMIVHGPPPVQDGPLQGPRYNFFLGKLNIEGDATHFESNGYDGVAYELTIRNGATVASDHSVIILSTALIDHSSMRGSLQNDSYLSLIFGTTTPTAIIDHGELHGDVSGFKLLDLKEGLVEANVNTQKIVGNGLIDGDVTFRDTYNNFIKTIEIQVDDHLEITGDLQKADLYFDIFGRDHFDTLDVGGSLQGQANWDLIDPYLAYPFSAPRPYFEIATHANFADGFFASIGDRFVLLHYIGGSIEYDALHRILNPNAITEEFQRDLLNVTFDNLPAGYQVDVFLENNDIGFRVVAVPEASTTLLVGVGLISLIAIRHHRRRSAMG